MSEEKMEVPQISLLDQLKVQRAQFSAQKELAQNNLNQLVGAIYACDVMIKKHEDEAAKQQSAGGQGNGETDSEAEEQTPEE